MRFLIPAIVALAVLAHQPVLADDDYRDLMENADIVPLETLIGEARTAQPGHILEVELDRKHGKLLYEVEVLDDQGVVHELYFDATTGELIRRKVDD